MALTLEEVMAKYEAERREFALRVQGSVVHRVAAAAAAREFAAGPSYAMLRVAEQDRWAGRGVAQSLAHERRRLGMGW